MDFHSRKQKSRKSNLVVPVTLLYTGVTGNFWCSLVASSVFVGVLSTVTAEEAITAAVLR